MADSISPDRRSANMKKIRSTGMKPEMKVRRLAHGMGYRYRLHRRDLPGKPDLVFVSRRKVIFVHGCFWHQHKKRGCLKSHTPKSNADYWLPKLERNRERDASNIRKLKKMGWKPLVIWECETGDVEKLATRISGFLEE